MPLYWLPSRIPELQHLPELDREELVDAAIGLIPINLRNLSVFVGAVVLPMGLIVWLVMTWGKWVFYASLPFDSIIIWLVFLNLAQPQIREQARNAPFEETKPGAGNRIE